MIETIKLLFVVTNVNKVFLRRDVFCTRNYYFFYLSNYRDDNSQLLVVELLIFISRNLIL